MVIADLTTHPEAYVTVAELAEYWQVSRRSIYKQIEAGTLKSIRLGPRLYRIRTDDAREFERGAKMRPADRLDDQVRDEEVSPTSGTGRGRR